MFLKKIILVTLVWSFTLTVQSQPTLVAPANASTDVEETPLFEWSANTTGTYTLELYECEIDPANDGTLQLNNFELTAGPLNIDAIYGDLSGLTYNALTGTFFGISNGITQIFEMDTDGSHLRTISLNGFEDTEGLVWIGGEEYFLVEERRGRAVKITVTESTENINYPDTYIQLEGDWGNNLGIEGIAYEAATNSLLIVKEKLPSALYRIEIPENFPDTIAPAFPFDINSNNFGCSDFSGLHLHQNLLILSHEGRAVVQTDMTGNEIARLELGDNGANGTLESGLLQAEGITVDDKGTIYVVSEPNIFYKFENPSPPPLYNVEELAFSNESVGINSFTLEVGILNSETQYCWRVKDNAAGEWSDYWTFTTGIITEVAAPDSTTDIQLFFHPNNDSLMVEFSTPKPGSDAQIVIYDISGKQVMQHKFDASTTQSTTLNTKQLAMGVYILSLKINQRNISRTFVKY